MKKKTKNLLELSLFLIIICSIINISGNFNNINDIDRREKENIDGVLNIYPSASELPNQYLFQYYKVFTIDHKKVSGSSNYSNFPVLISIFDTDLHNDVQSDGDDIAFANDTTWLDHELELFNQDYNSTHAQLIAWVRVPLLSVSANTNITMYYGNPYLNSQENSTRVWDSNYKGVWHMKEINPIDSTSNNNNGNQSGGVLQIDDGRIDGANLFMGDDEFISIGNLGSEIKTIEFWMKPSNLGVGGPMETDWKSPNATGDNYDQWSNPTNAFTSDDLYAEEDNQDDAQDWYAFNFNIPNGATIDGIQIKVEAMASSLSGAYAALSWDGGNTYTSERLNTWTSEENKTYGGSGDNWSRTWSSNDFKNNNFRIRLKRSSHNPGTNLTVDYITIKVYYTYVSMKIINLNSTAHIDLVGGDLLTTNFPGTTTIYIDGVINSSLTENWHCIVITDTKGVNVSEMEIGRVSTEYFDGRIDEFRVSDLLRQSESFNTSFYNQNDPKSFYNISQEVDFNTAPPIYSNLTESSKLLELGETENIKINVTAPSGINQVIIEFEGLNHSMTHLDGDTWQYDSWNPSQIGNYTYIIYMEDNCNNWNSVNSSIMVIDTTPPSPPIITSAPSGEVFGNLIFDWGNGFDLSGISFYVLIIDDELDPFATPGFVFNITIPNTGADSSFYELSILQSPGTYYYFLCQIDGVGLKSNYTTESFDIISSGNGKNNITFLDVLPYILASVIASIMVIIVLRKRIQKKIHPPRKKIPLKVIISHINKISTVKSTFEKEEHKKILDDQLTYEKETLDEEELENRLNEIKTLGEELFNEGAYLEALKQFEIAEELLLKFDKKDDALYYSKLIANIKSLSEEREIKSEDLENEKEKNNFIKVMDIYIDLIQISKKLKDFDMSNFYHFELNQLLKDGNLKISDLEHKRNKLEEQANTSLDQNLFEEAAKFYKSCEEISHILLQFDRVEENYNIDKFRDKISEVLKKIK